MIRKVITRGFGVAPNSIINNPDLSLKAIGLWLYVNSKPESWDFSISGVTKQKKDGRDSVSSAVKELESFGYLKRIQSKNNGRFSSSDWILTDEPFNFGDSENTDGGLPDIDQSCTSNKDSSKIELVKKERVKEKLSPRVYQKPIANRNAKKDTPNGTYQTRTPFEVLSDSKVAFYELQLKYMRIPELREVFNDCSVMIETEHFRNWRQWSEATLYRRFNKYIKAVHDRLEDKGHLVKLRDLPKAKQEIRREYLEAVKQKRETEFIMNILNKANARKTKSTE